MASSATDYKLVVLPPEKLTYYAEQHAKGYALCSGGTPRKRCTDKIEFEGTYTYESNKRTGRRTWARHVFCFAHAYIFARRHSLPIPQAKIQTEVTAQE